MVDNINLFKKRLDKFWSLKDFVYAGYGTVKSWRYRSRRDYGAVKIISFSLSVTRLVLTPTPNPKRPTKPKFHHEMAWHFKITHSD